MELFFWTGIAFFRRRGMKSNGPRGTFILAENGLKVALSGDGT
jgi:hypothetical protein